MFALESAMDELAVALNMDPIELRRINDTTREPINGKPYTSRSLMACFDEGAKAFGWANRKSQPKSMSDGDWLIGYGCATTCYPTQMAPAAARVRLQRDGRTRVEIAGHEIGNGAYTVIGQAAAEKLGVPVENVSVFIGDSDLPPAPVAGGSNSTASTCSAVMMVCDQIRQRLFKALMPNESLVDKAKETVGIGQTASTQAAKSDRPLDLAQAFDALGVSVVEEYGEWKPDGAPLDSFPAMHKGEMRMVGGSEMKDKIAYAFGAEFVEVRINRWTHEIRVPRLLGAFAAGHIMNPRTARSQLMGGLIWGMSSALLEATELDERYARYVNDNLADYLVPVNADVPSVEVIMLAEQDDHVNPAGVKGIGELGNVGTNAAICNAIFHATGQRLRKLPVRLGSRLCLFDIFRPGDFCRCGRPMRVLEVCYQRCRFRRYRTGRSARPPLALVCRSPTRRPPRRRREHDMRCADRRRRHYRIADRRAPHAAEPECRHHRSRASRSWQHGSLYLDAAMGNRPIPHTADGTLRF